MVSGIPWNVGWFWMGKQGYSTHKYWQSSRLLAQSSGGKLSLFPSSNYEHWHLANKYEPYNTELCHHLSKLEVYFWRKYFKAFTSCGPPAEQAVYFSKRLENFNNLWLIICRLTSNFNNLYVNYINYDVGWRCGNAEFEIHNTTEIS